MQSLAPNKYKNNTELIAIGLERIMSTFTTPKRKMIDIHMHMIPGVDDGAEDMMMARMMLLRAKEQGICQIFATPHSSAFDDAPEKTNAIFQQLSRNVAFMYPDMKVYSGCEVYCEAAIMDQVVEALVSGRYPTMNGSKYVLMEFSMWVYPEGTIPCVQTLIDAGYKPIIAHIERYKYLRDDMSLVDQFRELGALIQLNVYDLFDEMDDNIRNWARRLVQEQKVDFLGTDAHRTYYRPPSAEWGLNWLYENVAREYADAIAWKNAEEYLL